MDGVLDEAGEARRDPIMRSLVGHDKDLGFSVKAWYTFKS